MVNHLECEDLISKRRVVKRKLHIPETVREVLLEYKDEIIRKLEKLGRVEDELLIEQDVEIHERYVTLKAIVEFKLREINNLKVRIGLRGIGELRIFTNAHRVFSKILEKELKNYIRHVK